LTFPPESLGGEEFLGEFLKTQYIIPLFILFPLFKNNIYNKRINGKEYTNNPLKKNGIDSGNRKIEGLINPLFNN
jgi:hypothetical protein